ncbi:uncharacterized protein JCM15063_006578 [Sporobolomyces koalae]|uniref:uncharacterized protein n=1 Tax=Sporobolomyces koalae TaxID=500713 RepID=UPI00316CC4A9
MAFLWGSSAAQTEFDALLDKTTSDLLPSSTPIDLSLALQLADLIRSNSVPPATATKALVKRLQHDNPNVQLLALQLLDVCIKNGGTPFLVHLAATDKECSTQLERLAKGSQRDVKDKALDKLQEWATAFKTQARLRDSHLVKTYDQLRLAGLPFPVKDPTATAAMVDSLSAPEWQDSSYCTRCRTDFSTFNRKHHCRNCGDVFDQACSSQVAPLPHYGITQPVRVCDACHKKIKEGKGATVARNKSTSSSSTSNSKRATNNTAKSRKEQEDEDLRKAIEASLQADTHGPRVPPPSQPQQQHKSGYNAAYTSDRKGGGEEEDPDLAAAIAASLKDLAPPPTAPRFDRQESSTSERVTYSDMFPSATRTSYEPAERPPPRVHLPNHDLDSTQLALVSEFATTFTPAHPGPRYVNGTEHELANRVVREVQPQLERSVEDTKRRRQVLRELEWKLGQAAQAYGAGLTEQTSQYTTRTSYHQPSHEPQYATTQTPLNRVDPQYQYHPTLIGQPLPAYAVPAQPEHSHYVTNAPVPREHAPHEQQQQPEPAAGTRQSAPPQQQANGYYKPSSFPTVPRTELPTELESLPHAPVDVPQSYKLEQEQVKVGELIEF